MEPENLYDDGHSYAENLSGEILTPELGNFIRTPVTINGFNQMAVVIMYNPEKGIIRGANGERMEDRIRTAIVLKMV